MKTLFLLSHLVWLGGLSAVAAEYTVASPAELEAAWGSAANGDTIKINGSVDVSGLSLSDKQITITSADTSSISDLENVGALPTGTTVENIKLLNYNATIVAGSGINIGSNVTIEQFSGSTEPGTPIITTDNQTLELGSGLKVKTTVANGTAGAVHVADGAQVTVNAGSSFEQVRSLGDSAKAGAIYVADQSAPSGQDNLVINASDAQGDVTFDDNGIVKKENNKYKVSSSNDIYLGSNATAKLNAEGASSIALNSGISSEDETSSIVKTGTGTVSVYDGSNFSGSLDVQEGEFRITTGDWGCWSDGAVTVSQGAVLSLESGSGIAQSLTLRGGALNIKGSNTVIHSLLTAESGSSISFHLSSDVVESENPLLSLWEEASLADNITLEFYVSDELVKSLYSKGVIFTVFYTDWDMAAYDAWLEGASFKNYQGNILQVKCTAKDGSITVSIPEPATVSLSLMALAALCCRRRRV